MLLVEIKDFNALIDNKSFFEQPVKSKQEVYEKPYQNVKKMFIQQKNYVGLFLSSKLL